MPLLLPLLNPSTDAPPCERAPAQPMRCLLRGLAAAGLATTLVIASTWPRVSLWDSRPRPEYASEPLAKATIRYFDQYLLARAGLDDRASFEANVDRALAPDIDFESVGWGPGGSSLWTHGRDKWTESGEERQFRAAFGSSELFTQMLFFGDNVSATTTSYGTLHWSGELLGMPPPKRWIEMRVCDFYRVALDRDGFSGGLITYNFMMIDWPDLAHRAGYTALPPAPAGLEDGLVLPPSTNDGVPAPFSILARGRDAAAARRVAEGCLLSDWVDVGGDVDRWWHSDLTFYGPRGVGLARGARDYRSHVLEPFRTAFANRTLDTEVSTCEGNYCAAMGRIEGHHVGSWLGLPASHKRVQVRFGMHWRIVGERAQEGWAIFDVPGLYHQLGLDFFASAVHGAPQPLRASAP